MLLPVLQSLVETRFIILKNSRKLLDMLKEIPDDILVYTGYKRSELQNDLLENINILIDGEYIEELNDNTLLKGLSNQEVHILGDTKVEKYRAYLNTKSNKVQIFSF